MTRWTEAVSRKWGAKERKERVAEARENFELFRNERDGLLYIGTVLEALLEAVEDLP